MDSSICFIDFAFVFHRVSQDANERFPHIPVDGITHKNKPLASQHFQHSMSVQPIAITSTDYIANQTIPKKHSQSNFEHHQSKTPG